MTTYLQSLYVQARTMLAEDREKGQGTLEYVGIAVVAAILVLAVVQAVTDADITGAITTQINNIINAGG